MVYTPKNQVLNVHGFSVGSSSTWRTSVTRSFAVSGGVLYNSEPSSPLYTGAPGPFSNTLESPVATLVRPYSLTLTRCDLSERPVVVGDSGEATKVDVGDKGDSVEGTAVLNVMSSAPAALERRFAMLCVAARSRGREEGFQK